MQSKRFLPVAERVVKEWPEENGSQPVHNDSRSTRRVEPSFSPPAGTRLHTAAPTPLFDTILKTLDDGAVHSVEELYLKAAILHYNEKQVDFALSFLSGYGFVKFSRIQGEVELSRPMATFFRKLKELGDP